MYLGVAGLLDTLQMVQFCLNVRLGLLSAFRARDGPGEAGGGTAYSGGNPTYLDPKRESEVLKEESVLAARLRRGPGEPQNDSWGLTNDAVQLLTAQRGIRDSERSRGLPTSLGVRANL